MLLHLRPRCFSPFKAVELVDLAIPELGISLAGGRDLVTRRPYGNKFYAVASRNVGRKAIDGFYIETDTALRSFSMHCRWAINSEFIGVHRVTYTIDDDDFDAVSDDASIWTATSPKLGGWTNRTPNLPPGVHRLIPVDANPYMEIIPREHERPRPRSFPVMDILDPATGWIVERHQLMHMPTLERDRVLSRPGTYYERRPALDSAFVVAKTRS